ncbi:Gag protein [Phytophthora palmivora]|uniref:Gag protein n=1 Tax=Phytophthora palmivora TaxID=4796 RepID=A0A2P4YMV8_9STRA|nr:Gag protein [Phytophthora palmivora]
MYAQRVGLGEFPHLTDTQFELARKMAGGFRSDIIQRLAAATPAEQVKHIEAFDTYERRLIAHVQGLQVPVAELQPVQPKPLKLKGKNHHFWIREVELAMNAALISTKQLRVAFTPSSLDGRAKTWACTSDAMSPAAFFPVNFEYHQRSRFLACKQGKHELREDIQDVRVLATTLVGIRIPEHIKVIVFMDGQKVGPFRTQPFCVQANTKEKAIQILL